MNIEDGRFRNLKKAEFQPIPAYADYDRAPIHVTSQTAALLKLMANHGLPDTTLAFSYLREFTLGYISKAKEGFNDYFTRRYPPIMADINPEIITKPPPDLETREAIDHMAVVMSHMHDVIKIRQLPMGFSRRGMLGYPETRRGFEKRLLEMEKVIEGIIDGRLNLADKEFGTPIFRTYAFFETAQLLPFVYPKSNAEIKDAEEYLKRLKMDDVLEPNQLQAEGIHESLTPYQGNLADLKDKTNFNHFVEGVGGLDEFEVPIEKVDQPYFENNLEAHTPNSEKERRNRMVNNLLAKIEDFDPEVSQEALAGRAACMEESKRIQQKQEELNRIYKGVDIDFKRVIDDPPAEAVKVDTSLPRSVDHEKYIRKLIPYPEPKGKPVTQEESAHLKKIFEGFDIDLTLNPELDQTKPPDTKLLPPKKAMAIDENQIAEPKNRREKQLLKKEKRIQRQVLGKLFSDMDPLLLDPMMDPKIVKAAREREKKITREILEFNILLEGVDLNL